MVDVTRLKGILDTKDSYLSGATPLLQVKVRAPVRQTCGASSSPKGVCGGVGGRREREEASKPTSLLMSTRCVLYTSTGGLPPAIDP